MSNELVARARELVENQVAYFNRRCEEIPLLASIRDEEMWQLTANINSWKVHLAEMDELETQIRDYLGAGMVITELQKRQITKAKRLLGE